MLNLFPHQKTSLDLTEGKNRVAYYLDMGLGKTFVGSEKMKWGKAPIILAYRNGAADAIRRRRVAFDLL